MKIGNWWIVGAHLPDSAITDTHNNLGNRHPFIVTQHSTEYIFVLVSQCHRYRYALHIIIPPDFCYDGASCPPGCGIQPIRLMPCGLPHDYLYRNLISHYLANGSIQLRTLGEATSSADNAALLNWLTANQREFSDKALYHLCKQLTTFRTPAGPRLVYLAVRLFGASSYQNPAAARRAEKYRQILLSRKKNDEY